MKAESAAAGAVASASADGAAVDVDVDVVAAASVDAACSLGQSVDAETPPEQPESPPGLWAGRDESEKVRLLEWRCWGLLLSLAAAAAAAATTREDATRPPLFLHDPLIFLPLPPALLAGRVEVGVRKKEEEEEKGDSSLSS